MEQLSAASTHNGGRALESDRIAADEPSFPDACSIGIRVIVCSGHSLVRAGLRTVLRAVDGIELIAEVCDASDLRGATVRIRFASFRQTASTPQAPVANIIVLDGESLGLDDALMVRRLTTTGICSKVIVLVDRRAARELLLEYLRAGAQGLVLRDAPAEQLLDAIRAVGRGDAFVSPPIARHVIESLVRHLPPAAPAPHRLDELTRREREILDLLRAGMSNAEIASTLSLSEKTVKFHVSNVLSKLHVRSRMQAVASVVPEDRP